MSYKRAPWPDFKGNLIHEGDTIRHPDGQTGVVIFMDDGESRWLVSYNGDPCPPSRLCLQVGDKGQAVVVTSPAQAAGLYEQAQSILPTSLREKWVQSILYLRSTKKGWALERHLRDRENA